MEPSAPVLRPLCHWKLISHFIMERVFQTLWHKVDKLSRKRSRRIKNARCFHCHSSSPPFITSKRNRCTVAASRKSPCFFTLNHLEWAAFRLILDLPTRSPRQLVTRKKQNVFISHWPICSAAVHQSKSLLLLSCLHQDLTPVSWTW